MNNSEIPARVNLKLKRIFFSVLALYLILQLLWRLVIPAHEWASLSAVWMTVAFDVIMIVGLFVLEAQVSSALPPEQPVWVPGKILFVMALVAGLGLLALRFFHGPNGWWTGHLIYMLGPR